MQNNPSTVVILGTGGTIAGTAAQPADNVGYSAAQIGVAQLVAAGNPLLLPDVPFYPQTEYECGPAALAGVLGASGSKICLTDRTSSIYCSLLASTPLLHKE